MGEMLRLIYDYSVSNKLVDKSFIEKLVDIQINSKGISEYVKNMEIHSKYLGNSGDMVGVAKIYVGNEFIEDVKIYALKNEKKKLGFLDKLFSKS